VSAIQIQPIQKDGQSLYENTVKIKRNGGRHGPVSILFYFEDDTAIKRSWDGAEQQTIFKLISSNPLKWASVDHEQQLILESKPYNNILQAKVDQTWKMRWNLVIGKTIEA